VEIVEMLLVMPVLFTITLAVFEFGLMMVYHQIVTAAAAEGAREAAKTSDDTQVADVIQQFLALENVTFDTINPPSPSGDAFVLIERGLATGTRGNSLLTCEAKGPNPLNAEEVRVTVAAKMVVSGDRPVPNWLQSIGLDLSNSKLEVSGMSHSE